MIKVITDNGSDPITLFIPNFAAGISSDLASQIELNQADYAENIIYQDGIPDCRPGQAQTHTSYGVGGINGKWEYRKADGTIIDLEAWGTKLYSVAGAISTEVYNALTNTKACGFPFNGHEYIINGVNFIRYNGTTVATVASLAYVPTLDMGCKSDGTGSTPKEKLNYLSNSFKRSFSSDGSTSYQLPFTNLTSINNVWVAGVLKTLTTDYTIDLVLGKVLFVTGPATGGTNNVVIQATKAGLMDATKITKCKYAITYASRIWLTGNPDAPTTVYNTGLTGDYSLDGTYWPENGWAIVGGDDVNTGWGMHYNDLILFKERSIEASTMTTDASGNALFAWANNISPNVGCDMPDTIQHFDDLIAFCNMVSGPHVLTATVVKGQRNIRPVGVNCNGSLYKAGLLSESMVDLKLASSCSDGKHYWLCVGSKAWVWDYFSTPNNGKPRSLSWWFQTSVNARVWLVKDRDVYFGDRTNGIVQKLTPGVFNDNGVAIHKVLRTAMLVPEKTEQWAKNVPKMWPTLCKGTGSLVNVKIITNKKEIIRLISANETGGFNWDNWDWDIFTWDVDNTDKTLLLRLPIKNTSGIQVEFSNNEINQTLPIVSAKIIFELTKEI